MSIKARLFLQTLIIILIVIVAGSLFYIKSINTLFEKNIQEDINHDTLMLKNYIQNIKYDIFETAQQIAEDEAITASLNLISKYEDKDDYNALVFNGEKEALLDALLQWTANEEKAVEISFYDDNKEFVAKVSDSTKSYLSWNEGNPLLVTQNKKQPLDKVQRLKDDCVGKTINAYKEHAYWFCYTEEIVTNEKVVGYVKTSYGLNKTDLAALKNRLIHKIYLQVKDKEPISSLDLSRFENENYATKTILAYSSQPNLYANFIVDIEFLQAEKNRIIFGLVVIAGLLALIAFIFAHYFSKHLIIDRLSELKSAIESIKSNKYQKVENSKDDELGKIIDDFNEIFEKLSHNFSFLDSYKKSVDIANIVSTTDLKGKITYVNEQFVKTSGYLEKELLGKPHSIIRHPDMKKAEFKKLWDTIQSGKTWRGLIKNRQKSGGYYWADSVVSPIFDSEGNIVEYISIRRDVTELIEQKDKLQKLADEDSLTKLGSRNRLQKDLETVENAQLAIINIDRFSQVNDFYGHRFGDLVLRKFAKRLHFLVKDIFAKPIYLYRPNSDEFVLLYKGDKEEFIEALKQTLEILEKESLYIGAEELTLTLSCGVSFEKSRSLLLTADMALKFCKKESKPYVIYTEENSLNEIYQNNLIWTKKLKDAIEDDRIVPFFQPIVNNNTLAYDKYECLVRMIDEDQKVISPFFFLDIAKQTKQYSSLTKIMIEKSFQVFENKNEEFSINLTAEDILNSEIANFITDMLNSYPQIGKRLVFEIVESESIQSYQEVIEFIDRVKKFGCKIAIDDFGTGYSNFEYLIKLKADFIKIDGSLIKNIATHKESKVVVSVIVSFAKQMGIKTVAEFVEDEVILKELQALGIDYSQGYHFSPPLQQLPETTG